MQVSNEKQTITLNLKVITILLILIIAAMVVIWKPWVQEPLNSDRVISVTGQATLKAVPDEFVFYPMYKFENNNSSTALKKLSTKSNEIVDQLKKLGVEEKNIKTNASDYESGFYYATSAPESRTYTLTLVITVSSKDLAQKVQDYLVTTTPSGAVTPQPGFSEAKQKELESQAKNQAEKDARAKAEESAKNLGFKVGKVKSVGINNRSSFPIPLMEASAVSDSSKSKLTVHPGENDFYYAVEVVYYIR